MNKQELLNKKEELVSQMDSLWVKFGNLMDTGMSYDDWPVLNILNRIGCLEMAIEDIQQAVSQS